MHYITNYTIKNNCSEYQIIMVAVIVKKIFDNYKNNLTTNPFNLTPIFVKSLLKEFNQQSHDWKYVNCWLLAFS